MVHLVKGYTKTPVGAHYGLGAWLLQRLTAVVMAVYTIFLVGLAIWWAPQGYADYKAMFSGQFIRLFTMFFIISLLYHAWVGVRDIVMDYIKPTGIRLTITTVVGAAIVFYLIWSVSILWGR
jgi:succinate dehydrogenase / fumarate reductase membrane anchor subunit